MAIAASIEVSPQQALENPDLPGLFAPGCRVYITDLGATQVTEWAAAARRLTDLGYVAVPHLAARRVQSGQDLERRIAALATEAGVRDMLIVGGSPARPAGPFGSAMDVLETGLTLRHGITDIAVAGHPEGNADFPDPDAAELLRRKAAFAERSGTRMRIVTQFGFDAPRFIAWADGLAGQGIALSVHIGVAGPAKLTTLLKYAVACGVGNSLSFLRKRAMSFGALTARPPPDEIVGPLERHVASGSSTAIKQIHVFPFGGLSSAADWLRQRGSWPDGM